MNEIIKKYIEEKGITEDYLAKETGISEEKINDICSGKIKIDVCDYVLICKALDISIEYFVDIYIKNNAMLAD